MSTGSDEQAKPYVHQKYPALMYDHKSGAILSVNDAEEAAAAAKKGHQDKPSPRHDYSSISNGKAALKSKEELAEIEEAGKQPAKPAEKPADKPAEKPADEPKDKK